MKKLLIVTLPFIMVACSEKPKDEETQCSTRNCPQVLPMYMHLKVNNIGQYIIINDKYEPLGRGLDSNQVGGDNAIVWTFNPVQISYKWDDSCQAKVAAFEYDKHVVVVSEFH